MLLAPSNGGARTAARAGFLWSGVVRQPLLHFLLAGSALTVLSRSVPPPIEARDEAAHRRIVLTSSDVARVRQSATTRLRRPPADRELSALIEDSVRTEILAREAVRLGLDRDDPIIKARLAEKLDFLAEDVTPLEPTAQDIESWVAGHRELYTAPSHIDFQQVAFTFAEHGSAARADATAALAMPAPESLIDRSGLRFDYADFTPQQTIPLFGPDFTAALFKLEVAPGWHGPVPSTLGWHLVRVTALMPAPTPDQAHVAAAARNDWIDYQRVEARRRFYANLRSKYDVVLPTMTRP